MCFQSMSCHPASSIRKKIDNAVCISLETLSAHPTPPQSQPTFLFEQLAPRPAHLAPQHVDGMCRVLRTHDPKGRKMGRRMRDEKKNWKEKRRSGGERYEVNSATCHEDKSRSINFPLLRGTTLVTSCVHQAGTDLRSQVLALNDSRREAPKKPERH